MKVGVVLIVDDEQLVLRSLERHLRNAGRTVLATTSAFQARKLSQLHRPELAIVDLLLDPLGGVSTGIRLIEALRKDRTDLFIVAQSGVATAELVTFAYEAGANVAMKKELCELEALFARVELGTTLRPMNPERIATLDCVKREHLQHALNAFGSTRAAARALHMHRSTLQRQLKKDPVS